MTILTEGYSLFHLYLCCRILFAMLFFLQILDQLIHLSVVKLVPPDPQPWVTSPNLCPCGLRGRSSQQCRWTPDGRNGRKKPVGVEVVIETTPFSPQTAPACHSWPSSPCCCFLSQKQKDFWQRTWIVTGHDPVHWKQCSLWKSVKHKASMGRSQHWATHNKSWQVHDNGISWHLCPSRSSCACCGRRTSLSQDRRALNLGNIFWNMFGTFEPHG